ncbi:MAG: hypothetical protein IJQ56_08725 [Synergistaceae bacterium]|nr:hypothetical protein [Synergistaceae bacterium]
MSIITIYSALKSAGISREESVYVDFSEQQMNFPMPINGRFEVCQEESERKNYASWRKFYEKLARKKSSPKYQDVLSELRNIEEQNRALSSSTKHAFRSSGFVDEESRALLKLLRLRKKELEAVIKELEREFQKECEQECARERIILNTKMLRFNEKLLLNRYENIRSIFPMLPENPDMPYWLEMPFFTNNLYGLKVAMERGEDIAIMGGACLFGLQEVYIVTVMDDGTEQRFDYNTAHYGGDFSGESGCEELEELFTLNPHRIRDVYYINNKARLTRQEYYELWYPFEMAKLLGAKLVIPIPDFSYIKYVTALADKLQPQIRDKMISRFSEVCFKIADLMLDKINEIKMRYPEVEYKVIHARDAKICREFEQQRSLYLMGDKSKDISRDILRHITKNEYRQQSTLDYCTVPALPLYLYGIRNILQVDSVKEVDTYHRCCQLHKTGINLAAMLYPEYVSRDGQHTVFFSALKYKDYIR